MADLIPKKCVPHKEMKILGDKEIKGYFSQLKDEWILDDNKIKKQFKFEDFAQAIGFVNKIAAVAEKEGHHPDFEIHYNEVNIILWSHFINGLSINDFVIAAKIDQID